MDTLLTGGEGARGMTLARIICRVGVARLILLYEAFLGDIAMGSLAT